ncbi:MAG: hypothetical protein Athens101410_457 [Parcubacteria group bacterium Athens1014_10]|nr:MAG: hypothetical protein Athens101410_457 [Parcubacteria group bacterium Athens1014_10]TSD05235.1 MAG: hypothetical protein Athens071412_433 [Parcubacteria group bacterium Athens0714_12]
MFAFKKAQTLIEVITVLGIITMALVAILSLGAASINFSGQSKEEVIASNLAREGIEILRSFRDDNWLINEDAFKNLDDGYWVINYNDPGLEDLADSNDISACANCQLYFKEGFYNHDSEGVITPYKRLINIITNGDGKKVISRVSWIAKNQTKNFSLETYLTDWR